MSKSYYVCILKDAQKMLANMTLSMGERLYYEKTVKQCEQAISEFSFSN